LAGKRGTPTRVRGKVVRGGVDLWRRNNFSVLILAIPFQMSWTLEQRSLVGWPWFVTRSEFDSDSQQNLRRDSHLESHMPRRQLLISDKIKAKLKEARVARLATLDAQGGPHMVPICFAYDGKVFYTAVDRKPKRVAPERLVRLRHIQAEPQVALLIDQYEEDWTQLWYILVRGKAKLIPNSLPRERARDSAPGYPIVVRKDEDKSLRTSQNRIAQAMEGNMHSSANLSEECHANKNWARWKPIQATEKVKSYSSGG
jgi:PPOX class probable F420-dependent enzyme